MLSAIFFRHSAVTANLMGGPAGPSDRGKRHSPITARMNSKTTKRRAARRISESNSVARTKLHNSVWC